MNIESTAHSASQCKYLYFIPLIIPTWCFYKVGTQHRAVLCATEDSQAMTSHLMVGKVVLSIQLYDIDQEAATFFTLQSRQTHSNASVSTQWKCSEPFQQKLFFFWRSAPQHHWVCLLLCLKPIKAVHIIKTIAHFPHKQTQLWFLASVGSTKLPTAPCIHVHQHFMDRHWHVHTNHSIVPPSLFLLLPSLSFVSCLFQLLPFFHETQRWFMSFPFPAPLPPPQPVPGLLPLSFCPAHHTHHPIIPVGALWRSLSVWLGNKNKSF